MRNARDLTAGSGGQNAEQGVDLRHIREVGSVGLKNEEFRPSGAHGWKQRRPQHLRAYLCKNDAVGKDANHQGG